MKHYLKYHFSTEDGTIITRIVEIPTRNISDYVFPTRNVFDIEVFDSEMLPEEFSNYTGKDFLNKNFYKTVANVQKYMIGKYLPFEECKLSHSLTKHDIASGRKWGLTGFCINDGQYTMVGPETKILSPNNVKIDDVEQA